MDKLKSMVPKTLKNQIAQTTTSDLPSTCSSLLNFFDQLPMFHHMTRQLTDPETALCCKNKENALESKKKGTDCFVKGDYPNALRFYNQALRVAPTEADDMDRNLVSVLYVNRAFVLHKLVLLEESLRDCNRALVISPSYAKAWYRRGKINASLGNYADAILDLKVSMNMEHSGGTKRQIESELSLILNQQNGTSILHKKLNENNLNLLDEPQIKLQCVSTPMKGRGMVSLTDVPESSLVHAEEPYAVIISKHSRETHCHFCLNELPADIVPCSSCSLSLYCSLHCQLQAGGKNLSNDLKKYVVDANLCSDLRKHVEDILNNNITSDFVSYTECNAEHRHECQGVNWPSVLPSEVVLAGRVLTKSMEKNRHKDAIFSLQGNLDLCDNYVKLSSGSKVELHIYSIILLHCLQHYYGSEFPVNGIAVSQCVVLLSQININSMAIVHMKNIDVNGLFDGSGKSSSAGNTFTTTVEQVRVGQGIYLVGSLFNHSCQPNIHSYFLSRTLYVRATEYVPAGYPLELSYGPQVGQWDCKDRQRLLEDQYSFQCQCSGCLELNLSDLVLNALQCVKPNCFGVVLDSSMAKYVRDKVHDFHDVPRIRSSGHQMQVREQDYDIKAVACQVFEKTSCFQQFEPGYCLNCGSLCDLKAAVTTINDALMYFKRLEHAMVSVEFSTDTILAALGSLDMLKSTLHAYNKRIAEAEDNLAHACCLVGDFGSARAHCNKSIEILEKLYGANHIVIANELVKLSSIQLSLGDSAATDSRSRACAIFSRYYGVHSDTIFPFLQRPMLDAHKLGN